MSSCGVYGTVVRGCVVSTCVVCACVFDRGRNTRLDKLAEVLLSFAIWHAHNGPGNGERAGESPDRKVCV